MKLKVNKRWWQFWLPSELDVEYIPDPAVEGMMRTESTPIGPNPFYDLVSDSSVEADEAEPWYGGDTVEDEESSIVTAEPPVVYASRGNAKMAEREKIRGQM